jgi:PTH1 family peptidyl-tRNA hydrolase
MRLGIGDRGLIDAADFVLAKFRPSERPALDDAIMTSLQAIGVWASRGLEAAMNRFNGPADPQASQPRRSES